MGGAYWITTVQIMSAKLPVDGKITFTYFPEAVWAFCHSFYCLMWQTPPLHLSRALSYLDKHLNIWPGSDSWRTKSARSNNTSLTFYCVKYFYLSLRCMWTIMGADCRWVFFFVVSCVQADRRANWASKQQSSLAPLLASIYHSVRRETKITQIFSWALFFFFF